MGHLRILQTARRPSLKLLRLAIPRTVVVVTAAAAAAAAAVAAAVAGLDLRPTLTVSRPPPLTMTSTAAIFDR